MREVVIVAAVRTPMGNFNGALAGVSAADLGGLVIKEAVQRAGIAPNQVDEVIMGSVLQAGLGQNIARQAAIKAGIPYEVPSYAINKVCGSGLKVLGIAANAIMCGDADIIVAGGTENMSQAPYLLDKARWGYRMGDNKIVDCMIKDGLWDAYNNYHMGITAENVAEQFGIDRAAQDAFSLASQQKTAVAQANGAFDAEIVPVVIPSKKGDVVFAKDEFPKNNVTAEALAALRPAFKKDGTVTAGNASGINDGAAAIVLMSADKAKELGLKPMARFKAFASGGVDPAVMGIGPIPACKKVLKKAGLTIDDIDLIEANEAFAAQCAAVGNEMQFPADKLNVNGGAISLGHPIGASGCRILVTLLHAMQKRDAKLGLATLCIGGGQGAAFLLEI